jgi:hypothetical protein
MQRSMARAKDTPGGSKVKVRERRDGRNLRYAFPLPFYFITSRRKRLRSLLKTDILPPSLPPSSLPASLPASLLSSVLYRAWRRSPRPPQGLLEVQTVEGWQHRAKKDPWPGEGGREGGREGATENDFQA